MADEKDWEDMTLDEKTNWLRKELRGFIDFFNNRHLPEINGKIKKLTDRVDDL